MTVAVDVAVLSRCTVPQPLAEEIVQQYADVLRVGRVMVNGAEVCWDTSGSTRSQLQAFSVAFCGALRKLPESNSLEDSVLCQAVYWFCKVVSINYVLCEVLDVVKEKVGRECSITTTGRAGRIVMEYGVEVQPNQMMRVHVTWTEKGNIIHCDPKTAKKQVKGTLSSLATVFPMPPNPCFIPTYSLDMTVKRSYKEQLISGVVCVAKRQRRRGGECIYVDSPLHSTSSASFEACSTAAPSSPEGSLTSEVSVDSFSWDSWELPSPTGSDSRGIPSPLHFRARSVSLASESNLREAAKGFLCQEAQIL